MEGTVVFYQFSRSKIERQDFSHFLGTYSFQKLPTGRRLRQMMNSMVFCVDGYDDDPREIHTIPEVRKFYKNLNHQWPYSLYFANLDTDSLRPMALCCLENLTALKVDNQPQVAVQHDRLELLQFISRNLGGMNVICERAGMFESKIYDRSKAVFEYFGLLYDGKLPN